jgi:hypothetical protein
MFTMTHRNSRMAPVLQRSLETAGEHWGQLELTQPHVITVRSDGRDCKTVDNAPGV